MKQLLGEIKAHFLFENYQFSTKICEIGAHFCLENEQFSTKIGEVYVPDPDPGLDPDPDPADPETQKSHTRFARATVAGLPGSNRPATLYLFVRV